MRHTIICLLAFFGFGTSFGQSFNNDGDTLFGSSTIHTVYFNFYHPQYYDSLIASYVNDTYYTCDMVFDGIAYDSVGIKFKGNSSYNNPSVKKSMKIDLDYHIANQDIDDLNKFNLGNGFKDPTFMREKLMCDFMIANYIPAPRVTYAKVYYNNQYWGFFTLTEEANKDFVDGWFNDKRGNLFKGDPSGDLKWIDANPASYYNKYELKTNETQNDWTDLVQLIKVSNNTPIADLRDSVDSHFNTSEFLRGWAACNIFSNLDSYIGSGHNYYIYHDSVANKFRWIMYDVNEAFGVFAMSMSITQLENLSPFYLSNPTNRPFCNNLLNDPASKQELTYWFCDLLQPNHFSNAALDPKIDSLANRIRTDVYADPNKFYSNQSFEDNQVMNLSLTGPGGGNFPGLKSFITNRRNSLMSSLAPFGCYLGTNEEVAPDQFSLFPNPSNGSINLITSGDVIGTIEVFGLAGNLLYKTQGNGGKEISLDLDCLPSGTFLMRINQLWVQKFSISR